MSNPILALTEQLLGEERNDPCSRRCYGKGVEKAVVVSVSLAMLLSLVLLPGAPSSDDDHFEGHEREITMAMASTKAVLRHPMSMASQHPYTQSARDPYFPQPARSPQFGQLQFVQPAGLRTSVLTAHHGGHHGDSVVGPSVPAGTPEPASQSPVAASAMVGTAGIAGIAETVDATSGTGSRNMIQSILTRLSDFAAMGSTLCAIHCVVFPLMIALLPLIGAVGVPGCTDCALHAFSSACCLWFVGPIAGLAIASNFMQHKQVLVGLWGVAGIALTYLANIHFPCASALGQFMHAHHSIVNLMGAALLLSNNAYTRTLTHQHGPGCSHHH